MFVSSVIIAVICLIIMAAGITLAVVLSSETRGKKSSMWHPIEVLGVKGQEQRFFHLWLFEVVCGLFLGMFKYSQKQECIPVGCLPPAFWPYPSMHCPGGVSARGYLPGGYLPRGGVFPGGMCIPACNGTDPSCGQTDTCENITFANFVGGW